MHLIVGRESRSSDLYREAADVPAFRPVLEKMIPIRTNTGKILAASKPFAVLVLDGKIAAA
ncbi:hypothetical protein [Rhizobium sullae]|uniref:hypothetical protein n=1 Tax=Rhizobium sullae TaxID=50338 RepID=UPI001FCE08F5|nr:hypothetical protein [Rhizobium sullae]